MTLDPIIFNKNIEERLTSFCDVMGSLLKPIPACEVTKVWGFHVGLHMNANNGLQALWKIPRFKCEDLNIQFPTVVFVEVDRVYNERLVAQVTILAVQDDIDLPDEAEADLVHLYPTVQQRIGFLNAKDIAECLDNLRFFYSNIWLPWDEYNTDDTGDWVKNHFNPRVALIRDIEAGHLGPLTVSHIRKLFLQSKSIHRRMLVLERKHSLSTVTSADEQMKIAFEAMQLQAQLNRLCLEMEIVENPFIRKKVMEQRLEALCLKAVQRPQQVYVVWPGGKCEDLIHVMKEAQNSFPNNCSIKPCESLQCALQDAIDDDVILLCHSVHKLNDVKSLLRKGTIRGFPSASNVLLVPEKSGATLADWEGLNLKLQNITLCGNAVQAFLTVRKGILQIQGCHLNGDLQNVTTGIYVLSGTVVELTDCHLSGLDAGLVVNAGATLRLVRCHITTCSIGLQVYAGAVLEMKDCTIIGCLEYGLVLRAHSRRDFEDKVGNLKLLESYDTLQIERSTVQGQRGDVLITPLTSSTSTLILDDTVDFMHLGDPTLQYPSSEGSLKSVNTVCLD